MRTAVAPLLLLLLLLLVASRAAAQGLFPRLENVAAFRPVRLTPPGATCGLSGTTTFCFPSPGPDQGGAPVCRPALCANACPHHATTPPHSTLGSRSWATEPGACAAVDPGQGAAGAAAGEPVLRFAERSDCLATLPSESLGPEASFTVAVWLRKEGSGLATIIEKATEGRTVFKLEVAPDEVRFHYRTADSLQQGTLVINATGKFPPGRWTHLTLQVQGARLGTFINGPEEDGSAFHAALLAGPVADAARRAELSVGRDVHGAGRFVGLVQDLRFYRAALTNREVAELLTGRLPPLHVQSECRCPGSHPRVSPLHQRYCVRNGASAATHDDRVPRVSPHARPLSHVNDDDASTVWVSAPSPGPGQPPPSVAVSIELRGGSYQVFYVIVQFLSPQPEGVRIQRRPAAGSPWVDWQVFAKDCVSMYNMSKNGPLEKPDSVNCLQFPREVPLSRGNVTFSVLTPEPNLRPGYNAFYATPALQAFVLAAEVRVLLEGRLLGVAGVAGGPLRPYHAVSEVIVSGRCECHGHAERCDSSTTPYRCLCSAQSNTEGPNCELCRPLFRDKPWRAGDTRNQNACRPCLCYGRALSCRYEAILDPHPGLHWRGGGGVCQDCTQNTTGQHCERCVDHFYMEVGADVFSPDLCRPCDCHRPGVLIEDEPCSLVGGQCRCKPFVTGRRCDACRPGYYDLRASSTDGCTPCGCHVAGTRGGDPDCEEHSGQCRCKPNVRGAKCDSCDYGFKLLSAANPLGCESCNCSARGALDQLCDPGSGQCACVPHAENTRCDACSAGYYGLRPAGCSPCECDPQGAVPGSACDGATGRCACKRHVAGRRCDSCSDGFFGLSELTPDGCSPCGCDPAGTANGTAGCDARTGRCHCKALASGSLCSLCRPGSYNLSETNAAGCEPCLCDPQGTEFGTVCDGSSGQCACLPGWAGRRCSTCQAGFYRLEGDASGCRPCDCHERGSAHAACDGNSGQCACTSHTVGGRRCHRCAHSYYGFAQELGRCRECACSTAGSLDTSCHPDTGQCSCKALAMGRRCDACTHGASHLRASNPFGCSKTPSQQPPPVARALGSSAIGLAWSPPDAPNSDLLTYILYRNDSQIYSARDQYPFGPQSFNDTDLSPYTSYSYSVRTANVAGGARSPAASQRTLAGPPPGGPTLEVQGPVGARAVSLRWSEASGANGPVRRYVLESRLPGQASPPQLRYAGLGNAAPVPGLSPFTSYEFAVRACTDGGCRDGRPLRVVTRQAAPEGQAAPRATALGPTELGVSWDPPSRPNGALVRFELFLRGPLEGTNASSPSPREHLVHESSGWLDSQAGAAPGEVALPATATNASVGGLRPFSTYELRVIAVNHAGAGCSPWTRARTGQGALVPMAAPEVVPVSATALKVSWGRPAARAVGEEVLAYRVARLRGQMDDPHAPPVTAEEVCVRGPHDESCLVEGLEPFSRYNFSVSVCTERGCVGSAQGVGVTLPAAPAGQSAPSGQGVNASTVRVAWREPARPHGEHLVYRLERTLAALASPPPRASRGVRFPGYAYYHFPHSTFPTNAYYTGLRLRFRTRQAEGLLLLLAASRDARREFVALLLHDGRPRLLFDPQGGAASLDGERRCDDGAWHHVEATRAMGAGELRVDGEVAGVVSDSGRGPIIGENTLVFVGALPRRYALRLTDIGDEAALRRGFVGCMSDLLIKRKDSPLEEWEPLEWDLAAEASGVPAPWEGCPTELQPGAHFLGHGFLELRSGLFSGEGDFEVSLQFRTERRGEMILLFAHGEEAKSFITCVLSGEQLLFAVAIGSQTALLNATVGRSYCDGRWHTVTVGRNASFISASLDGAPAATAVGVVGDLKITSPFYLGGVPPGLPAEGLLHHRSSHPEFGGCVGAVSLMRGSAVELVPASVGARGVSLDGCPRGGTGAACGSAEPSLVYSGTRGTAIDTGLDAFTEYLYRVTAVNEAGFDVSPWERVRSREGAPAEVRPPHAARAITALSAELLWAEPAVFTGVVSSYELRAYHSAHPEQLPVTAAFSDTASLDGELVAWSVRPPSSDTSAKLVMSQPLVTTIITYALEGKLEGLTPHTNYSVTLLACTAGGCTESSASLLVRTARQAASESVPAPEATASATSLLLSWPPPREPRGVITHYSLYRDEALVYKGTGRAVNITGLGVFSVHTFVLSACTEGGCANSSAVTLTTTQLPPTHVAAPTLSVLDAHSINVQWSEPLELNGELQCYELYAIGDKPGEEEEEEGSTWPGDGEKPPMWPKQVVEVHYEEDEGQDEAAVARGGDPLALPALAYGRLLYRGGNVTVEHSLRQLIPGTLYQIRVAACTLGGCRVSEPSAARTEEAAPEGVALPVVRSPASGSLLVSWGPPVRPNGVITSHGLLMNGSLVHDSPHSLSYRATGLAPWSPHTLRARACTARGCALGAPVEVRTQEAAPTGHVELRVATEDARTTRAMWLGPAQPNGRLTYSLTCMGPFYSRPESGDSSVVEESREVHSGHEAGVWVLVRGLVPLSSYSCSVNASNSRGHVLSNRVATRTPAGAPDGVEAPSLTAVNSTAVRATWGAPAPSSAPGVLLYQLQMRRAGVPDGVADLFLAPSTASSITAAALQPHTRYEFRLIAYNNVGSGTSNWSQVATHEDSPGAMEAPTVSVLDSSTVSLRWQRPAQPNGRLSHYGVYCNGSLCGSVPGTGTELAFRAGGLRPFSPYAFAVEACTLAGCSRSPDSPPVRTLPASLDEVSPPPPPPPRSPTPSSVLVAWRRPRQPPGRVVSYALERRRAGSRLASAVATWPPHDEADGAGKEPERPDESPDLVPWTAYEHRVPVGTAGGVAAGSEWNRVTTRHARPGGLRPPRLEVLGPDKVSVQWAPPLQPNGRLARHELLAQGARAVIGDPSVLAHTLTGLVPFTDYAVSLLACSSGGADRPEMAVGQAERPGDAVGTDAPEEALCTESDRAHVRTPPAAPEGVFPPVATPASKSLVVLSWQPPARPNGPRLRYELLRCKVEQPLSVSPPRDINLWMSIYLGTDLSFEDKGLSRFTRYAYRLLVHNTAGSASSTPVLTDTLAGVPLSGSHLEARALNHTALVVNWTRPGLAELQGAVTTYTVSINSSFSARSLQFPPDAERAVIAGLSAGTLYRVSLSTSNGAHAVTSTPIHVVTPDGVPEGLAPPQVEVLNGTAVRVAWAAPPRPQGRVTSYAVVVDGHRRNTGFQEPGSTIVGDLQPFTAYSIQLEVCTRNGCSLSDAVAVVTVEEEPQDVFPPHLGVLGSSAVRVEWDLPGRPRGLLRAFSVRRSAQVPCAHRAEASCPQGERTDRDQTCGSACYSPLTQVCCGGVVHEARPDYACCDDRLALPEGGPSAVCCGGRFHRPLVEHTCCEGHYVHVKPGEACCWDPGWREVAVGPGDACCGARPYALRGQQRCCGDTLLDASRASCCGRRALGEGETCCGEGEAASAHLAVPGMVCCGGEYVASSLTVCCPGDDAADDDDSEEDEEEDEGGTGTAHAFSSPDERASALDAGARCCGSELLDEAGERRCPRGGQGLAAAAEPERLQGGGPGEETTLAGLRSNRTDADECFSPEFVVFSGPVDVTSFTDAALAPHTTYRYRVVASNRHGYGSSVPRLVTTEPAAPRSVSPPRWSLVPGRQDALRLSWQPPLQPNGPVTHYMVERDGLERHRGSELHFLDEHGVMPFRAYHYRLAACTVAGCTFSRPVTAATAQGPPEDIAAPVVTARGPRSLSLSWAAPGRPNGAIHLYRMVQAGAGVIHTHMQGPLLLNVSGLEPFSSYRFALEACTAGGCSSSPLADATTLESAPQGVWLHPRNFVVSSSVLELHWAQPAQPNGRIVHYRLHRSGRHVYTGGPELLSYTDRGLRPNSSYVYTLEAATSAGVGSSGGHWVRTPPWTPEGVPAPHDVRVLGPRSILASWRAPAVFNLAVPVEYNVTVNLGSAREMAFSAAQSRSLLLEGLEPHRRHELRVLACQSGGCGLSAPAYAVTEEAAPEGQGPPGVAALGTAVLEVTWSPPEHPNGDITTYVLYRRDAGARNELVVFVWSEGPLVFTDASPELRPGSAYEYRVRARNRQGETDGPWARGWTREALLGDLELPGVTPHGPYSLHTKWRPPHAPHGAIRQYRLEYGPRGSEKLVPSPEIKALTVPGERREALVFGLEPHTLYQLRVVMVVVSGAGEKPSPWASARTLEAAPRGLAPPVAHSLAGGRSILLHWDAPARPNGIVQNYSILSDSGVEFSGLARRFVLRRLVPYKDYSLALEACTSVGCARSGPVTARTGEAAPASQPGPDARPLGPTSVELRWTPPRRPHGRILRYLIIGGGTATDPASGRRDAVLEEVAEEAIVNASMSSREKRSYVHRGLKPGTAYRYKVRSWNSAGFAESGWVTVRTPQAAPAQLAPPSVRTVPRSPRKLCVSWTPPLEPNGELHHYRLLRNGSLLPFIFDQATLNFTDVDLLAHTDYSYAVEACTAGGCVTSPATSQRTPETAPSFVPPPMAAPINATAIRVSWAPLAPDRGQTTQAKLFVDDEERPEGLSENVTVSGLRPYSEHGFFVSACTGGGCANSSGVRARTLEAPPEGLRAPRLDVTNYRTVDVRWQKPDAPNGQILSYELWRDGTLVYSGLKLHYRDARLSPGARYSYSLMARNSRGTVSSATSVARTLASAPGGLAPPRLEALSSTEMRVAWDPPLRPNGDVVNYTVRMRDLESGNTSTLGVVPGREALAELTLVVGELAPRQRYEACVEACTAGGCASSEWARGSTLEAPPALQPGPSVEPQADGAGDQAGPRVSWASPLRPNGPVLRYELYRRGPMVGPAGPRRAAGTRVALVYNGTARSFRDGSAETNAEYEYKVRAVNAAGHVDGVWVRGRTGPAPPLGLQPPSFSSVAATSAVVLVSPPTQPNGIVTVYRVFANSSSGLHMMLSEGASVEQEIHGLEPFSTYSVYVQVCTCLRCCADGPPARLQTLPATPTGQPAPAPSAVGSRAASLAWSDPTRPNGIMHSFELQKRMSCPQPPQPLPVECRQGSLDVVYTGSQRSHNVSGLLPYCSYDFRIISHNQAGSTASAWSTLTTHKEAPEFVAPFDVSSNLTALSVDWSASFHLNGPLREFALSEGGTRVFAGLSLSASLPRTSDKTFQFRVTCTTEMGSVSSPIISYNTATGIGEPTQDSGGRLPDGDPHFYSELWFVSLLSAVGMLLMAVVLALLLRRAMRKPPYTRQRPPLLGSRHAQATMMPLCVYPSSDNLLFDHLADSIGSASSITLRSFTFHNEGLPDTRISSPSSHKRGRAARRHSVSVIHVPPRGTLLNPPTPPPPPAAPPLCRACSHDSLHHGASRLIETAEATSLPEEPLWDALLRPRVRDSGMMSAFGDDEELLESMKAFTICKEHTVFTDTHL
uniref:Usherin n=1 Tax=Petromyzon marinus TaxID=7757 RepID=A0AAJ7SQ75_PETMA|nr:usherin [Petromyzon marinus]